MPEKICHITTVHPAFDNRIFDKECVSLAEAGFEVHLLVANQEAKAGVNQQVKIHSIDIPKSRLPRFVFSKKIVLKKALEINARIYHFHDPELLPVGRRLKELGKKVVYDSHEDVPRQILFKSYLPSWIRPTISGIYEKYENRIVRQLDGVVSPTPHIQQRFAPLTARSVQVANFPKKEHTKISWHQRRNEICYVGSLTRVRGIKEMVQALEKLDTRLHLAGHWWEDSYRTEVTSLPGWSKVNELGFISKQEAETVFSKSKIGLVTLHPIESYQVAYAVKMFEYMANGIPVIASNFPLWEKIINESHCGICVDPLDPEAIAKAIQYLLDHEEEAKAMGERGQQAYLKHYNWDTEIEKLVALYEELQQ